MTEPATAPGHSVLLVDDDSAQLRNFRWCLEDAGFRVHAATHGAQALQLLNEQMIDLCFLDIGIGDESGLELLPQLLQVAPWLRVVMATAESAVSQMVSAIRAGAVDYLVKPCAPEMLVQTARRQAEARRMQLQIEQLQSQGEGSPDLGTRHAALAQVIETARQVADTDASVLLLGESGTGKNVLARAIHQWSGRAARAFATVNCPSLSAELLESELFGHVKGAFTGAIDNRQGRAQLADGGSLFLDEIGDFPLALQPKLLRFVQDREFERVGDPHTRRADVRIIAATNRDLQALVGEGRFREDLYYRLNVIALHMPPLRERREDIGVLAQRFLLQFATGYRRPARSFDEEALAALQRHDWPGNIRELRNVVERIAILAPQEVVTAAQLPPPFNLRPAANVARVGADISLAELERAHITAVVASSSSLEEAARILGIDTSTLYRKRKQYAK
jgi:NtrC-family two-component system response regulator AlgB